MESDNALSPDLLNAEHRTRELGYLLATGLLRLRNKLIETFPLASTSEQSVHGLGDKNASKANSK